jgi:hypothetical protein
MIIAAAISEMMVRMRFLHSMLIKRASKRRCSRQTVLRDERISVKRVGVVTIGGKAMSGKQSPQKKKSSNMQKRGEGNLGQKEAQLEKEKDLELTHTGEKTGESEKSERDKGRT